MPGTPVEKPQSSGVVGASTLTPREHARVAARFDSAGDLVLLTDQDRTGWDAARIDAED